MTEFIDLLRIEPISKQFDRKKFDCRNFELTEYLHRFARQNDTNNIARCFVAVDSDNVIYGYFTLSTLSVEFEELPAHLAKGLPKYPIPAALIGMLAVDSTVESQGLGTRLLINAFERILSASEKMAVKAVIVDAIDGEAKRYYQRFGFEELPGHELKMFLPIETVAQLFI